MKNKMIASAIALIGFAASANAQVSANADVTATIVMPIAITKTVNMNFGNVAVSDVGGTVVLPTSGVRAVTGGVTLPATVGTINPAEFEVAGASGYTFAITLPSTAVTISNGTENMAVSTFVSSIGATGTLAGGTTSFKVGATLAVAPNQGAGVYTKLDGLEVTVNYN